MLKRNDYLEIIESIRNIEKVSLEEFITTEFITLKIENQYFIETLYKDIDYILSDLDKIGDNDLAIENGDFVIEDDDIKLTGYQTRLHDIFFWLHMEIVDKKTAGLEYPNQFIERMEKFDEQFLTKQNYTPEYRAKLDKVRQSIKKERQQNSHKKSSWFRKLLNSDNLELKPNIAGIGINLNELINTFKK